MPAIIRALVFCCCLFYLLFPPAAHSYFIDDFSGDHLNPEIWTSYQNAGTIVSQNGKLTLHRATTPAKSFPYIHIRSNIFPESGPFSIYIKYRFLTTGNFGDGIVISPAISPENGIDSGTKITDYNIFGIWQDFPNGLIFDKVMCNIDGSGCNTMEFLKPFTHIPDYADHEVRIDYTELGQYFIYLDGSTIPNYISAENQKRPKSIWLGNSQLTSTSDYWSSFEVDYIKVLPTSTTNPIVLIPGFGASWDMPALLAGTAGSNWTIPPFVKNYDGIINSLINSGYELNTDLFVFPYDWRKKLDDLAGDLNSFIESKGLPYEKFDIVGHSMGGLVARAYGQKYGSDRIDQIITAGTPHFGVIDMYGLWEGAKVWNGSWWQNLLLEIATEMNKLPGESRVTALRRVSPSIIDLFPTFPFIVSGGVTIGIDQMNQRNEYLYNMNQNSNSISDVLTPFWSEDISQTRNAISTEPRTTFDIMENKWEDGRPIAIDPFSFVAGDGSVTKVSATGPFVESEKLTGWHGDLLSSTGNNEKILQKLGLDPNNASFSDPDVRGDAFVAILRSPGYLEVCDKALLKCNDQLGIALPEYKLFIIPDYDGSDVIVKVKESGMGTYRLHLGYINESPNWVTQDGELKETDQQDFYIVRQDGGDITSEQDTAAPVITITSPISKTYLGYEIPDLDYFVSDNWDKNPDISISGWSQEAGSHTLSITAKDVAGNLSTTKVEYQIVFDTQPPTVIINSPKGNTYDSKTVPTLKYTVTDDWDEGPTVTSNGWSNTEGVHTVTVTATDKSGNVGITSVTYTVQNPPTIKDHCKNSLWKLFRLMGFKNQGACVSFVESLGRRKNTNLYFIGNLWGWKDIFHRH